LRIVRGVGHFPPPSPAKSRGRRRETHHGLEEVAARHRRRPAMAPMMMGPAVIGGRAAIGIPIWRSWPAIGGRFATAPIITAVRPPFRTAWACGTPRGLTLIRPLGLRLIRAHILRHRRSSSKLRRTNNPANYERSGNSVACECCPILASVQQKTSTLLGETPRQIPVRSSGNSRFSQGPRRPISKHGFGEAGAR
jgi:hypothetical protein